MGVKIINYGFCLGVVAFDLVSNLFPPVLKEFPVLEAEVIFVLLVLNKLEERDFVNSCFE
jgi:hypothetical protein